MLSGEQQCQRCCACVPSAVHDMCLWSIQSRAQLLTQPEGLPTAGTLDESWGLIPGLQVLSLHDNNIKGILPSAWGSVKSGSFQNLTTLQLWNISVTGTLPAGEPASACLKQQLAGMPSCQLSMPAVTLWRLYGRAPCCLECLLGFPVALQASPGGNHCRQ